MVEMHRDALPLSPPYWCAQSCRYAQRIEYCNEEFILSSAKQQPDISLPLRLHHDVSMQKIEHSEEEDMIWRQSRLLSFGSYGFVREYMSATEAFPLVKLAHQTPLARQLIFNEFLVLSELSSQYLPIVKINPQPLVDHWGIFGFSMEKLFRINPSDLPSYVDSLEDVIRQLHSQGFVHGDISPSNVMRTEDGEIRLIDLSHAGKVNQPLPEYHPGRKLKHWHTFEEKMDLIELEKIRRIRI
jgi:RIO-like serine/threonine protein kinase